MDASPLWGSPSTPTFNQAFQTILRHPFVLQAGKRHCESKLFWPRTQHNDAARSKICIVQPWVKCTDTVSPNCWGNRMKCSTSRHPIQGGGGGEGGKGREARIQVTSTPSHFYSKSLLLQVTSIPSHFMTRYVVTIINSSSFASQSVM